MNLCLQTLKSMPILSLCFSVSDLGEIFDEHKYAKAQCLLLLFISAQDLLYSIKIELIDSLLTLTRPCSNRFLTASMAW